MLQIHSEKCCADKLYGTVLFEKLMVIKLLNKFLPFMEPESSLPHLQESIISSYSELHESSSYPPSLFHIDCNITLGLQSGFFPLGFPTKLLYAFLIRPMQATCLV